MCGALAISAPSRSKIAQEKSSRSLMFTDWLVFSRVYAHLLGDRHEEIVEYLEHHRIDGGADSDAAFRCLDALQQQMTARGESWRASRVR